MTTSEEIITMQEAALRLGVSDTKIWRLVRDGTLPARRNPLDRRQKLIRTADVEKLAHRNIPQQHFLSDGIDATPGVPSDQIKDWIRQSMRD